MCVCVCVCVLCRLEEIQSPSKKLPPESTPRVMFTGFEPMQVQQFTKVKLDLTNAVGFLTCIHVGIRLHELPSHSYND